MRRVTLAFLVAVSLTGCAHPPPTLSPPAAIAWQQHEIQKDLDLIRDIAQDATAQVPPLISMDAARTVTLWHREAITIVHDSPGGWLQTVLNGLNQLESTIPPAEYAILAPYVNLAKAILAGVQ